MYCIVDDPRNDPINPTCCISGYSEAAIRRRYRGRNSAAASGGGETCDATGSDGFSGFGSKPAKVLGKQASNNGGFLTLGRRMGSFDMVCVKQNIGASAITSL